MPTPPSVDPDEQATTEQPSMAEGTAPAAAGKTRPLVAALATTGMVTAISYLAPEKHSATLVGMTFLAVTWWLVLRHDEHVVRAHGLSLGGLLEPARIDLRRLGRAVLRALLWATLLGVVFFPLFWLGFLWWWRPHGTFVWVSPPSLLDEIAGQTIVIALPEEAFFRGYLQTSLERAFRPRARVLGVELGLGWLLAAAIFAVGHLLTVRHPARLAVFFPALLFGWLRKRTNGIGASVLFHAACNVLSATLVRGYGA